jgi:membrane-associated phospholipid phosphatase
MAFSRLAAGAHYLSDIIFGFLIAFGIVEAVKKSYHAAINGFDTKIFTKIGDTLKSIIT